MSARRVGFFGAAAAPWQGLWLIVRTPAAWPLAAVPIAIATVLIVAIAALSIGLVPRVVGDAVGATATWWGGAFKVLLEIMAVIAGLVLALVAGALLAQPLSSPALERLIRLTEASLGLPPRAKTSFWLDAWRSLRGALIGLSAVPIVLALTAIELAVPGSSWVVLPLKLFVSGLLVSWDLLDYPLGVRDLRLRDRLAWMGAHKAEVIGFGLSLACVFLVPCLQLVLLPAGVVGATLLVRAIELAESDPLRRRAAVDADVPRAGAG